MWDEVSTQLVIDPPGGESVDGIYQVRGRAIDVFGGSLLRFFRMQRVESIACNTDDDCPAQQRGSCVAEECTNFERFPVDIAIDPDGANFVGSQFKLTPGQVAVSQDWNLTGVDDGRYFVVADLIPGPGASGFESQSTRARAGRNNKGDGKLITTRLDTTKLLASGNQGDGNGITGYVSELVFRDPNTGTDFSQDFEDLPRNRQSRPLFGGDDLEHFPIPGLQAFDQLWTKHPAPVCDRRVRHGDL